MTLDVIVREAPVARNNHDQTGGNPPPRGQPEQVQQKVGDPGADHPTLVL
jgi:hypothetical protein